MRRKRHSHVILFAACCCGGFAQPAWATPAYKDIDFAVEGMVVDADGVTPVQGANVALTYRVPGDPENPRFGGRTDCVKAKGAITDREGRFFLPVEKLDNLVAYRLMAIKRGYYISEKEPPATSSPTHGGSKKVTVRIELEKHVASQAGRTFLARQRLDEEASRYAPPWALDCWRARYREDAAAILPFLDQLRGEDPDAGGEVSEANSRTTVSEIGRIITLLRSMPARSDSTR